MTATTLYKYALLMTDSADDLRQAITDAGGVAKVARSSKVKDQTLYSFMKGDTRNLRADTRDAVLAGLDRLNGGTTESEALPADFKTVPIVDIDVSAGPGTTMNDGEIVGYQPFRTQMIDRITRSPISKLAVIQVRGDSMEPALSAGDQILIDTSITRVGRDAIYVLAINEELVVKRCSVELETGNLLVQSDNPSYSDQRVSDIDMVDIKGRVIWIGRALG